MTIRNVSSKLTGNKAVKQLCLVSVNNMHTTHSL